MSTIRTCVMVKDRSWRPRRAEVASTQTPSEILGPVLRRPGGWSATMHALMTVIVLLDDGITWGVNAWRSNGTDQRRYREEMPDADQ